MPSQSYWALQKERREKQRELMWQWEKDYYFPALHKLQDACEHNYVFSHAGAVHGVWFTCTICCKNQFRDE